MSDFMSKWNNSVKATEEVAKRITLRSFGHSQRNSHETLCFGAKIVIDGILVGTASNDGFGGSTAIHIGAVPCARLAYERVVKEIAEAKERHGDCLANFGFEEIVTNLATAEAERRKTKAFVATCAKKGMVCIITRTERIGVHPSRVSVEMERIAKSGGTVVEVIGI
jgi:hypothetical protein